MPEIPEHLPPSSLDQFIGDFLVDADDPSLSKLPREVEYMDDPWFDTAYIQFKTMRRLQSPNRSKVRRRPGPGRSSGPLLSTTKPDTGSRDFPSGAL
ncbi:hypothetical protein [Sporisorium scitamineum]|uniref:Uncharacterized protein n=1 Tax=Sporisorium scitamineum TaxID=49012 RepID=A0A0F7RUY7_9BASI|nr:hypothetical protein [Sporisorium scitamineum]